MWCQPGARRCSAGAAGNYLLWCVNEAPREQSGVLTSAKERVVGNATNLGSNFSKFLSVRKVTTPVRKDFLFCAVANTDLHLMVVLPEWHKACRGLAQSLPLIHVLAPSRYFCPSFTRVFGQAVLGVKFSPYTALHQTAFTRPRPQPTTDTHGEPSFAQIPWQHLGLEGQAPGKLQGPRCHKLQTEGNVRCLHSVVF